jgi:glycosyltransferase involved in cell wall biosynthesis
MHVALCSPGWPLQHFQNGIITYVHAMKLELERLGHRVSVFTPVLHESGICDRVHLVDIGKGTLWGRATRRLFPSRGSAESDNQRFAAAIGAAMLRVHARDPIDVIEMEESFGWFAEVERVTSLPLVVKLHGPAFLSYVGAELDAPFARKRIELEGKALARASTILSPCRITLSQTLKRYDLSPHLARHIVNPLVAGRSTSLWRLDTCDLNMLLFVGRFDLRKGADVVLQAFLLLLKKRPQLRLMFVGPDSGLPLPGGGRINFGAYCDKVFPAELRSRVEYLGPLANEDIENLRVKALVTIVASRWENPGYTLLEAMMQGCPVVSSDAGGCPEIVSDWCTGRLAKSEQPKDFAEKIASLLDDPERAAIMARAGRRYVLDMHSAEGVVRETVDIYERVAKRRRHQEE